MFCKNCGTQMADDQKFCPNCGTNNAAETPVAPVAPAAPVAETAPVAPVVEAAPTYTQAPLPTEPQQPKKKKTGLIVAISVIVAIVVAGGVCLGIFWDDIFGGKKKSNDDDDKATSSATSDDGSSNASGDDTGDEGNNTGNISGDNAAPLTDASSLVGVWKYNGKMLLDEGASTAYYEMYFKFTADNKAVIGRKYDQAQLDLYVDDIMKDPAAFYSMTQEEFDSKLESEGITLADFEARLRQNYTVETATSNAVFSENGVAYGEYANFTFENGTFKMEDVELVFSGNTNQFTITGGADADEMLNSVWIKQ